MTQPRHIASLRLVILTSLSMIAFAANSVIARMAFVEPIIDPWAFTAIRLISGACVLILIISWRHRPSVTWNSLKAHGHWQGGAALLAYAALFSLAYISLEAGTGALILFASVQITMIIGGILRGERLSARQIVGLVMAIAGLVILMRPSINPPPLLGALMMAGSGMGWGLYSLMGRGANDPTRATTGHFARASLLTVLISSVLILIKPIYITTLATQTQSLGIIYALISGIITSGLGYVIWYMALRDLTATRAAILQLSVPVLAALGGVMILSEPVTIRFVLASAIILGGVGWAVTSPASKA